MIKSENRGQSWRAQIPMRVSRFRLNDGSSSNKNVIIKNLNDVFIHSTISSQCYPKYEKLWQNHLFSAWMKKYLNPSTWFLWEIRKSIIWFKKKSACGLDWISTKFIRLSMKSMYQPLTYVCNQSLQENVFHQQQKKLQISFHYINHMIPCALAIIDLYHC